MHEQLTFLLALVAAIVLFLWPGITNISLKQHDPLSLVHTIALRNQIINCQESKSEAIRGISRKKIVPFTNKISKYNFYKLPLPK